jgi:hypothetical protein
MPTRDRVFLAAPEPPPIAPLEVFSLTELMARPDLMEKPPAVIPRLLYRERATLYAAREKLGKTTFATAAVAAISRGVPFLDEPTRRAPVLWMTEEHLGDPTRRLPGLRRRCAPGQGKAPSRASGRTLRELRREGDRGALERKHAAEGLGGARYNRTSRGEHKRAVALPGCSRLSPSRSCTRARACRLSSLA